MEEMRAPLRPPPPTFAAAGLDATVLGEGEGGHPRQTFQGLGLPPNVPVYRSIPLYRPSSSSTPVASLLQYTYVRMAILYMHDGTITYIHCSAAFFTHDVLEQGEISPAATGIDTSAASTTGSSAPNLLRAARCGARVPVQ